MRVVGHQQVAMVAAAAVRPSMSARDTHEPIKNAWLESVRS